jgi:hypothetical protein
VSDRRRGSFLLYGVAFGLFAASGVTLAIAATDFLSSLPILWTSVVLSALAVIVAIAGLVVPRR